MYQCLAILIHLVVGLTYYFKASGRNWLILGLVLVGLVGLLVASMWLFQ